MHESLVAISHRKSSCNIVDAPHERCGRGSEQRNKQRGHKEPRVRNEVRHSVQIFHYRIALGSPRSWSRECTDSLLSTTCARPGQVLQQLSELTCFSSSWKLKFNRYMAAYDLQTIEHRCGLAIKDRNTIVYESPLRLKLRTPQPGAQEEFNILASSTYYSPHTSQEELIYMTYSWRRLRRTTKQSHYVELYCCHFKAPKNRMRWEKVRENVL